jgi:hypothetical protein
VLAQLAGLTKANATYSVSGQVEEGVILQPLAALTSTTTGTGVDNAAASTNGGAAYLEVSALQRLYEHRRQVAGLDGQLVVVGHLRRRRSRR